MNIQKFTKNMAIASFAALVAPGVPSIATEEGIFIDIVEEREASCPTSGKKSEIFKEEGERKEDSSPPLNSPSIKRQETSILFPPFAPFFYFGLRSGFAAQWRPLPPDPLKTKTDAATNGGDLKSSESVQRVERLEKIREEEKKLKDELEMLADEKTALKKSIQALLESPVKKSERENSSSTKASALQNSGQGQKAQRVEEIRKREDELNKKLEILAKEKKPLKENVKAFLESPVKKSERENVYDREETARKEKEAIEAAAREEAVQKEFFSSQQKEIIAMGITKNQIAADIWELLGTDANAAKSLVNAIKEVLPVHGPIPQGQVIKYYFNSGGKFKLAVNAKSYDTMYSF